MGTRWVVAIATVLLVAGPAGCDDVPSGEGGAGPPRPAAPAVAVPRELQGTWRLDVYCAAVVADPDGGGFGEIAERPATSEGRTAGRATMTMTLYPEYFEIAWRQPDRTWRVGWSGAATVEKGVLHLDHRKLPGVRDSFTWSLDGHRLSLHYPAAGAARAAAVPSEAYSVTRFSLPWTAVDCPPRRG